jgi:hypothetical protein
MLKPTEVIWSLVNGPVKTDVANLERRVANLERLAASGPSGGGVRRRQRGSRPNHSWRAALAVTLGVFIGATLVVASLYIIPAMAPSIPPGSITLDGINTTLRYTLGSNATLGPDQNYCTNACPVPFTGGESYTLKIFDFYIGSGGYRGEINSVIVSSALPFEAVLCGSPGPCGITHSYEVTNISFLGYGDYSQSITVIVSDPAPSLSGGFWVYCNATVTLTKG